MKDNFPNSRLTNIPTTFVISRLLHMVNKRLPTAEAYDTKNKYAFYEDLKKKDGEMPY